MCRWVSWTTALLLLGMVDVARPDKLVEAGEFEYPERTVTVVCPWSPGGGTDRVSRFWAGALEEKFGQPFVVVNRTGGAGAVGHFSSAYAKPDGHTIGMITFELCTMHRMRISRLTYEDYECLLQVNADPAAIIVRNDAPWQTLGELLAEIRARPGELRMSGTATGGAWDLARAGLLQAADLPINSVVWVPHPGAAPSLLELMGGHLDAVCCSVPEVASQLANQQVRVLAVMAEERIPDYPDLATAREQGTDWVAVGWRGLALPKGTPAEIIDLLASRCSEIADSDAYRDFMQKNGFGIKVRTRGEFTEFLREQDAQWKSVVEAAGYDKGLTGNNDPGPHALPWALLVGLVGIGGWELARTGGGGEATSTSARSFRRLAIVCIALVSYVVAIAWLGFAVSTYFFVSLTAWKLGGKLWSASLAAGLILGTVWLLFVFAFQIQLPKGVLGLPF
ncbi:MAG: tripartite tricarboxylate transporter TctB family protein [Planctomycetaceae bacterium]|nr:tripartite tricarboxylate transporter TctB family protein [Planctomycetales bacterium]MCB9923922.1 tripartite tricarboxylate transporter TctB family protein [Planctomycetaceae bacterium]